MIWLLELCECTLLLSVILVIDRSQRRLDRNIFEESMGQGCFGWKSFVGIIDQKFVKKIKSIRRIRDKFGQILSLPLRECCFEVGQSRDSLPNGFVGCPKSSEDSEQLINLWVSRKQRSVWSHLCKDTTDWPDINWRSIQRRSQHNLWWSIPKSDYFMSVSSNRKGNGSGQTKVCQFDVSFGIDQKVLRFQVSMKNTMGMTMRDALK